MTDIAQIGFSVNTSDLDKAVSKLNALKPAAAGVVAATDKLQASIEGANRSVLSAAVAAAKAESSKAEAALSAARASGTATRADLQAANAKKKQADAAYAQAKAERDRAAAMDAATAASARTEKAAQAAAAALALQTKNAFNAAAGARSPGGGPLPANDQLPNRFNTANIAAQFQDIGVTAAAGMSPLTIALQQGTQLSAILNTMENPLKGIQIALASVFNTVSLGTIAIVALIAAGIQMVDWAKAAQGALNGLADIIQAIGPYVVGLAGVLALIYAPAVIAGLQSVVFWIGSTGFAAVKAAGQMAAAWIVAIGPVGWVILAIAGIVTALNVMAKAWGGIFNDIVQFLKEVVNKMIGLFVGFFEGVVSAAANVKDRLKGEGIGFGEAFAKGFEDGFKRDYVGAIADTVSSATDDAAEALRRLASGIGVGKPKKHRGKTDAEKYDDILNAANRNIESLKAEQAALGMTSIEASKLRHETDLLNDARQKGIELSPVQRDELGKLAETMAQIEEKTRLMKDALDFAKDGTRGFFGDLSSGLKQGMSLWDAFGEAVSNALDRVINKLLDFGVDQLFNALGGIGKSSAGGGSSSFIGKALSALFNADGNAFGSNGVQAFAKGGTFTNSVVSKPTMFAFGKGGQFGVMGEAGPEAVMPLTRAPDGSLGVQSVGGTSGGKPTVNVEVVVNGNAEVQQERQTLSDGSELRRFIINTVSEATANGDLDNANSGRYGMAPRKTVR